MASLSAGFSGEFGLLPGARVAIVMNNQPEYLEARFATWHAGLVAVPVNARLHRDEIAYIIDQCGTAVAVVDEDHAALDHFRRFSRDPDPRMGEPVGVVRGSQRVASADGRIVVSPDANPHVTAPTVASDLVSYFGAVYRERCGHGQHRPA